MRQFRRGLNWGFNSMKKFNLKYTLAPLALATFALTGCESISDNLPSFGGGASKSASEMEDKQMASNGMSAEEAARVAELERQNASLRNEMNRMRTTSETASTMSASSNGGSADLPPAKPGECYARILIPASYSSSTERVLQNEASEKVDIVPAKYNWAEERVLVSEASSRLEVVPATYRTVTEEVVVEPARKELRTVPAKYDNRSERVLVKAAYTTWKKGAGPIGGSLGGGTISDTKETATGEIMCLVEVPAEYRTVTKRVLVEPARTTEVMIPAVTKNVTKRVVATPATTREVTIPAKYETVRVRKLVTPAQERRTPVPATYRTVTKQTKVTDEKLVWREVLCDTNTTPDVVRRVQQALKAKGFNPGDVDGVLGNDTLRAVRAYQKREGLGTGGLTMATVKRLGVM